MIPYQNSLGIEIREDAVVLVHLRRTLSETRIQNSIVIPFSLPLAPEAEAEFVDSLKRFIRNIRVRPERTVVGLPRKSAVLKFIEIPSLNKENIPQLLEYEIEKHLPFNPEEVYYDFDVIEKTGENIYRVLITAVKKDMIDYLKDLLERVPLKPKIFDLSTFGIINALKLGNGFSDNKIDTLIFMGQRDIELGMLQGGVLKYSRILSNGESFVEGIQKEIDIALSGIDTKGGEKKVGNLILSGPGSLKPGLIELVRERVSPNARIEDIAGKIIMRHMERHDLYSLIPATGLALRGLGESDTKINFLPHKKEIGINRKDLYPTIILLGTIIFLGLSMIASYAIKEGIGIRHVEKKIETLRSHADAVEKIQREIKGIEERKGLLVKFKKEDLSKLDTLSELTRVIPDDAWLVSLDYTETAEQKGTKETNGKIKREMVISGFANSASKLIPLLEDSPVFENVEFAGPITSGVEGKERFRIKAVSKKVKGTELSVAAPPKQERQEKAKEEVPKKEIPQKEIPKKEIPRMPPAGRDEIIEDALPDELPGRGGAPAPSRSGR